MQRCDDHIKISKIQWTIRIPSLWCVALLNARGSPYIYEDMWNNVVLGKFVLYLGLDNEDL